jgi:hypothetical protein
MITIRYTQHHKQPIEWQGNGLYHWNSDKLSWIKLNDEELTNYVINPRFRTGLYLGLTESMTLDKIS